MCQIPKSDSWQFDRECSSLTGLTFHLNFPSMRLNDLFHNDEPQSGAFFFAGVEGFEEVLGYDCGDAGAGVCYANRN